MQKSLLVMFHSSFTCKYLLILSDFVLTTHPEDWNKV